MLDVIFGQATDAGNRANNEDAMGSFLPQSRQAARARGWMFAVADGVGGLDLGEVAAEKAVQAVCAGFAQAPEGASLPSLMPRLIQQANAAVHDERLQPQRRGKPMATTLVACALRYDQAYVAHVGDSRCYLVRGGQAAAVTRDHTLVSEQRKLGLLSEAEAAASESRHILTRSLGPELFVSADASAFSLRPGDILVLCTDGLHAALRNDDMARIVTQNKPLDMVARELVARAIEVDGSDNASAQVILVRSTEEMAMYRGRLYPRSGA
jgi:protein phosphatase